jgi:hemerythrin-like domain-containing protein
MNATDPLANEHRIIEQVLNCLEKIIEQATATGRLEEKSAGEVTDFFCIFAGHFHRRKEETCLFPLMRARGVLSGGGPMSALRCEHELGRLHLGRASEAIEWASQGDANALRQFCQHGESYIRLVREHIQTEDRFLFAVADRALEEPDQELLRAAFEKADAAAMGAEVYEEYLALANRLIARFGIDGPPAVRAIRRLTHRRGDVHAVTMA